MYNKEELRTPGQYYSIQLTSFIDHQLEVRVPLLQYNSPRVSQGKTKRNSIIPLKGWSHFLFIFPYTVARTIKHKSKQVKSCNVVGGRNVSCDACVVGHTDVIYNSNFVLKTQLFHKTLF